MRWLSVVVLAIGCGRRTEEAAPNPTPPPKPAKPPGMRHQVVHVPSLTDGAPPSEPVPEDPWPTGPFDLVAELPSAVGTGGSYGTANRVIGAAGEPGHRWMLMCQQRRDTDGDGAITLEKGTHWDTGDQMLPYFALGGGAGSELEDVVAVAADGDHLVLQIDLAMVLIDVPNRRGVVLPKARDVAAFTPDGKQLLYLEGDDAQSRVVRRTLATGTTTVLALPKGHANGMFTDGSWAVVELAPTGDMVPRAWSKPYEGWCQFGDPFDRYAKGDPTIKVWIDLAGFTVRDAAAYTGTPPDERAHPQVHSYNVDPDLVLAKDMGPLRYP